MCLSGVSNGQPAAGFIDQITCVVTSPTDPTLNHVEVVDVAVSELRSFKSDLYGPSGAIGLVHSRACLPTQETSSTTITPSATMETQRWASQ